jgi:hypothetical protein
VNGGLLRAQEGPYQCLGLFDVLLAEQELPVEVAQVNRVEVNDVDLSEAGKNEVLE